MKNKIKKFIKNLPTITALKKELKAAQEKIKDLTDLCKDLEVKYAAALDADTNLAKIERLEAAFNHKLEIIHDLREDNKKLREDRK